MSLDGSSDAPSNETSDEGSLDGGADAAIDAPLIDAGPTQPWEYVIGETLNGVATDSQKNVIVGGTTGSNKDFFLSKYDSTGNPQWSKTGSSQQQGPYFIWAVAADGAGAVYAAGYCYAQFMIGNVQIAAGGFLVKFDSQGSYVWKREYPGYPWCLAVKSNGNIVMGGELDAATNFGGGVITPAGADALALEVTASNTYVRAKTFGPNTVSDQVVRACVVDKNDNVFLYGPFEVSVDFGGGALSGPAAGSGSHNAFVAKLDSSFNYVAAKELKTLNASPLGGIAVDGTGNLYLAGFLDATWDFGGGTLTSAGSGDVYVAKLGPTLTHAWSKRYGDASSQYATSIAIDANGYAGVVGAYQGNLNFGQGNLPNTSSSVGMFATLFDSSGVPVASFGSGTLNGSNCVPNSTSYVSGPDFAIAGHVDVSCKLPSGTIMGTGGLVARMAP
jgi:hypothetical protein